MRRLLIAALTALLAAALPAAADEPPSTEPIQVPRPTRMLEQSPEFGTYYRSYEPTFYTGFAPRALEPERIHLHVGRGNQLRVTLVLSDETLAAYARDLQIRRDTYRGLVEAGRIVLTQNRGLEAFESALEEVDLEDLVEDEDEGDLTPAELRERNVRLMERLNPGRVFRISLPADEVVRRWAARLLPADREAMDRDRRLEVANAMLPTRLWLAEMDAETREQLRALVRQAPSAEALRDAVPPAFAADFFALLERVAPGRYPLRGDRLEFVEFTAIYPIGTFNEYTDYRGRKIPLYPDAGAPGADHAPAHPHRRPHPHEGHLQLLALDPLHARRQDACTTPSTRCGGAWRSTRRASCPRAGARRPGTAAATAAAAPTSGCSRAGPCPTAAPTSPPATSPSCASCCRRRPSSSTRSTPS